MQTLPVLAIAPAQVVRGTALASNLFGLLERSRLINDTSRPVFLITGNQSGAAIAEYLGTNHPETTPKIIWSEPIRECSSASLTNLQQQAESAQLIIGAGGGKVLDAAKLVATNLNLPVVTIPTSAATCAGWTALSNIYSEDGAFDHDVSLPSCPSLMVVDYDLIATAPCRTLKSGIGDAIAKWYEASVSSGNSDRTMVIAAVQQARVLRDILLQKSVAALEQPGSNIWREVVDACVCLAGVIGGIGGAECRTVAAHAVHNGLTHLPECKLLHGEKVAFGILVQLRLEEMQGNQLAATARQQLSKFYDQIGLPQSLQALGLGDVSLNQLTKAAAIACAANSDLHRLPFSVSEEQLLAAMVSTTTAPVK